jgi:hypothetical protein
MNDFVQNVNLMLITYAFLYKAVENFLKNLKVLHIIDRLMNKYIFNF